MLRRFIQFENARRSIVGQASRPFRGLRWVACAAILATVMGGVSGCGPRSLDDGFSLPVTPVISVRPRWAVATATYVRVSAQPDLAAPITGHLRQGDVAKILSISTSLYDSGGTPGRWYEIESNGLSGWASGETFEFFESESRARNAAGLLNAGADAEDGAGEGGDR